MEEQERDYEQFRNGLTGDKIIFHCHHRPGCNEIVSLVGKDQNLMKMAPLQAKIEP